jgi:hypothetical protein
LEALSRQSDAIADVLTVKREEHVLTLDGSGAGALSGRVISPASGTLLADRVSIPFDDLALVYHTGAASKRIPIEQRLPLKESYPKLPAVGASEHGMNCEELEVALQRAGAVRWFARQEGALPFTAHQQVVQHTKNTAKAVGMTVLVAAALAAGGGGGALGSGAAASPNQARLGLTGQVGDEALRWAVTSADRRVLGLLEIKRNRQCTALTTPDGGETDLAILAKIDSTRHAFEAHQMSDQEQLDQQTQFLDRLDPPSALASGLMGVSAGSSNAIGDPSSTRIDKVVWTPNLDVTRLHYRDYGNMTPVQGALVVGERELTLNQEQQDTNSGSRMRIDYADIAKIEIKHHWWNWAVVISHLDGHLDSLQVTPGFRVNEERTSALGRLLQTKLSTLSPTAPANR